MKCVINCEAHVVCKLTPINAYQTYTGVRVKEREKFLTHAHNPRILLHAYARTRHKISIDLLAELLLKTQIHSQKLKKKFLIIHSFMLLPRVPSCVCRQKRRGEKKRRSVNSFGFEFFHHTVYFIFDIRNDHTQQLGCLNIMTILVVV